MNGQKSACAHNMLIIEGVSGCSRNTCIIPFTLVTYLSSPIDTEVLEGRTVPYSSLYAWPLTDIQRHIQ